MSVFDLFSKLFNKEEEAVSASSFLDGQEVVNKNLFYKLLDLNDSIILFFNKKNGYIGANNSFFKVFGFEHIDDFRNNYESIRELFVSEAEEIFTEDDKSWMDYIRIHNKAGYRVKVRSKEEKVLELVAKNTVFKETGQELYILELKNITELENAKAKASEIDALKTKILSNIGHEFRTPMNGILGFLYLLEKTGPTPKQAEYLKMTNSSARSLMSNIETLLDLAQMQSGRLSVSKTEFSLVHDMQEIAKYFTEDGVDKGINVSFFIDSKLPETIEGDIHKIRQIINNLVQNAIKFTPRGGKVMVDIKLLKKLPHGACSVAFSVKDNGKGISASRLSEITQPFISSEEADQRLGVGLSLSYGLIHLLGGELKIQSEEGRGSIFNFSLDFEKYSGQSFKIAVQKNVKVLLLDDAKIDDANLLTSYLRSFSLGVTKVNSIDQNIYEDTDALYIVASQDKSSWLMELGTHNKKAPVIFLLDIGETLQTKMTHVIDEVITKPLLPSSVSEHLDKIFLQKPAEEKTSKRMRADIQALVVEDNLINQRLIKILLQEYNIRVVTASNGQEAVDICNNKDFDIVFMDIDMPVKNGVMATREIKEHLRSNGHTMPIIAVTALAMEGDREKLLSEGLDDYLSKPLTRNKLDLILNKYLSEMMV
ncbi:response regulator [Sulfurimonas sp. HSL-1716]|uniref:response regulator n=1 Tax=Hydrocurvibacter sulfurireducens TaxID=3131937 RepID=UPI0031F82437